MTTSTNPDAHCGDCAYKEIPNDNMAEFGVFSCPFRSKGEYVCSGREACQNFQADKPSE